MKAARLAMLILACSAAGSAVAAGASNDVEDIRIVRSLRLSRNSATSFCSAERTGFENAKVEDRYDFRAVVTNAPDGTVVDASKIVVGGLHACFGPTSDPLVSNFFAEGWLGNISFTGKGDCREARRNFPEAGITLYRCYLDIQSLPPGHVGCMLTTNTVTSRQILGEVSDPPGYIQPSIATVRLWKLRGN